MSDNPVIEYSFQCTAFASNKIRVHRAWVEESLSQPYSAEVDIWIDDPDADWTQLGGDDAILIWKRGSVERRLCGVVVRVEDVGNADQAAIVRVVLAPALELSRLRRNTRMFQAKKVDEILQTMLDEMLGPYGREAQLDLEETYEPREYCLQYQESDLDFVQRLVEEEGIAYSFDHVGDVEVLRLTDKNAAFEQIVSLAGDAVGHYQPNALALGEGEPIHRFDLQLESTTTAIALRDFDWSQSDAIVHAEASGEDSLGRTRESYEHGEGRTLSIGSYDEGAKRYQKNDSARQAPMRQEGAVTFARVGLGESRMIGMQPGHRFTLADHPNADLDVDYLVTRVQHVSQVPENGADEIYHNVFQCIPLETPYRPARTAVKPRIDGIQTAVVTGPSGEEIHTDAHGRIKVQFHWDRENPADETSSCWMRVKQEWAGPSWGFVWIPRIGMEVIVHFVDGDPDRPLVTGALYDGTNATPYPLPDDKTKSTIKSNTSLGGGGFNEFRFEDKAGGEEIYTHAQKDYNERVENDHTTLVHHDQKNTVDNDQTQTIDANQTERVDAKQTMTVGGNRTVHVKGNYDETVDGTETRKVTGNVTESFSANETRTVTGAVTETISGNETRTVGGSLSETISASHTLSVTGSQSLTVTGSQTRTATGGITTFTPASQTVTVTGNWSVTAAAGINITAVGGVTLTIPAGVGRADSFWDYAVGDQKLLGAINTEFTVSKIDIAIFSTSVWGVKLDFCDSKKEKVGPELSLKSLRARMAAAMVKRSGGVITAAEALALVS